MLSENGHVDDSNLPFDSYLPPPPPQVPLSAPEFMSYDPVSINNLHEQICRLAAQGMRPDDIAAELNVYPRLVGFVLANPIIKDRIKEVQLTAETGSFDLAQEINIAAKQAVDVLAKVISGDIDVKPSERIQTSQDMLDRAGYGKVSKIESKHQIGMIGRIGIEQIRRRAMEVASQSSTIVEESPANG